MGPGTCLPVHIKEIYKYILTAVHPFYKFTHMKMLTIRIPEELHKAFKLKCVSEGVDMGAMINKWIEGYVMESKAKKQK